MDQKPLGSYHEYSPFIALQRRFVVNLIRQPIAARSILHFIIRDLIDQVGIFIEHIVVHGHWWNKIVVVVVVGLSTHGHRDRAKDLPPIRTQ